MATSLQRVDNHPSFRLPAVPQQAVRLPAALKKPTAGGGYDAAPARRQADPKPQLRASRVVATESAVRDMDVDRGDSTDLLSFFTGDQTDLNDIVAALEEPAPAQPAPGTLWSPDIMAPDSLLLLLLPVDTGAEVMTWPWEFAVTPGGAGVSGAPATSSNPTPAAGDAPGAKCVPSPTTPSTPLATPPLEVAGPLAPVAVPVPTPAVATGASSFCAVPMPAAPVTADVPPCTVGVGGGSTSRRRRRAAALVNFARLADEAVADSGDGTTDDDVVADDDDDEDEAYQPSPTPRQSAQRSRGAARRRGRRGGGSKKPTPQGDVASASEGSDADDVVCILCNKRHKNERLRGFTAGTSAHFERAVGAGMDARGETRLMSRDQLVKVVEKNGGTIPSVTVRRNRHSWKRLPKSTGWCLATLRKALAHEARPGTGQSRGTRAVGMVHRHCAQSVRLYIKMAEAGFKTWTLKAATKENK